MDASQEEEGGNPRRLRVHSSEGRPQKYSGHRASVREITQLAQGACDLVQYYDWPLPETEAKVGSNGRGSHQAASHYPVPERE